MGFGAAPVCSETFTMAEDPKAFCCWGKTSYLGMQNDPSMESKWNPNDFGFLVTTLVRVSFGWFEEEQINMFV